MSLNDVTYVETIFIHLENNSDSQLVTGMFENDIW